MKAKLLLAAATVVLVAGCSSTVEPDPAPSPTTVAARECTHAVINLDTGVVLEFPTPCRQDTSTGCVGSVIFRIEEDGTVSSRCGEEVNQ